MSRTFDLLYHIPGMTDIGLEQMDRRERDWFWAELKKRKDEEIKASKSATKE